VDVERFLHDDIPRSVV